MDRVSVFARRQRIRNLEQWTMYAILVEAFFLALWTTAATAAIMFGVITWFMRSRIDTHYKMRSLPLDVPVAIFLLVGAASVLLSSVRSFELIYNYCMLVGIYALTYLIVGQTIRTPAQIKQVAKALGASAVCVVLWGFFQFAFGVDVADVKWTDPEAFPELRKRIFSTLENPNVLAGYLDVFICLALGLLAKVEWRSQKIVLVVAIIMLASCLAMTYSRGAFLAIAVVFAVFGVMKDWRMLILFAVVTGFIAYNDTTFVNRILSAFTMSDSSEGVRVGIWASTIAMISDHPFAGIGWGAYQYVYPQYNYYIADPNIVIYHAHNIYLNFAAEIGIVGALAFFWYFFGTMFMSLGAGELFAESDDDSFLERAKKFFANNSFMQYMLELAQVVDKKLADFSNNVIDLFSRKEPTTRKVKKTNHPQLELVHHDELKWSKRRHKRTTTKKSDDDKKSADGERVAAIDKISVGGEKISVKSVHVDGDKVVDGKGKLALLDFSNVTKIDDKVFLDGLQLGIGLAFLSMALNGFTDHLLFNIPSSMLMWQLGALGAAINAIRN